MGIVLDKDQLQAWSSVATIFLAAAVPFISARHARRLAQSTTKQAALDGLRSELSQFIGKTTLLAFMLRNSNSSPGLPEIKRLSEEVEVARANIGLRIDPSKPSYAELRDALNELSDFSADEDTHQKAYRRATLAGRLVLKEEGNQAW